MKSGQQPFGICARGSRTTLEGPRLISVDGHAAAQKAACAYMRSAGLAYKLVTTNVKAEKADLEGLGADARARVHSGHRGSNGILQRPPRQAHAACPLL